MNEAGQFLRRFAPFQTLPESALSELAEQIVPASYAADTEILKLGETIDALYVVRSGAVETYRRSGELFSRLAEGDTFGQLSLLIGRRVGFPVRALEDTAVYRIPFELFHDFCERYESFADFFEAGGDSPLRKAVEDHREGDSLTSVRVSDLLTSPLVQLAVGTSVKQAARIMTQEQVDWALITRIGSDGESPVEPIGLLTDRGLREHVLAAGLSPDTLVERVMSPIRESLDSKAYLSEAVLLMLRHEIRHLPIMQHGRPIGVLTLSDLVRHESQSRILYLRNIFQLGSVDELAQHARQLPGIFLRMVKEDANSDMVGSTLSLIGRSFKQRLLELAEARFGPPPVAYCFLALGSMARDEQLIYTDQDNAMILDDSFQESRDGVYFQQLAQYVCDGLDACGYAQCSGDIMATNPQWRKTLGQWRQQFAGWIESPTPQALLNGSIFFDLDGVWGRLEWGRELRHFVAEKTRNNQPFLASLARSALSRKPPLGFFKEFVLEKDGEHKDSINLKRRGTAPLTDVIRVHALAVGSMALNSFERLDEISQQQLLPVGKARELGDALEYIAIVRLKHQAHQIASGKPADNNIHPESLSGFERRNLKEAFRVLSNAQAFLKYRYNANSPLRPGA